MIISKVKDWLNNTKNPIKMKVFQKEKKILFVLHEQPNKKDWEYLKQKVKDEGYNINNYSVSAKVNHGL